MEQLIGLKKRFNPRRLYEDEPSATKIEVDGVFLRIDDSLLEQKTAMYPGDNFLGHTFTVDIEDLLQDPSIIRSARVSTGRDSKAVDEKSIGLIKSLHSGKHDTPFEGGVEFRLKVTVPICLAEPFFQMMGSHNEFSTRYSEYNVEEKPFFVPPGFVERDVEIYHDVHKASRELYKYFLDFGVAREQARFALIYSFFTEFYWTVSLRHLLELMSLEWNPLTPELFWGIRDNVIGKILKDWTPWAWDVKTETGNVLPTIYFLEGFSASEMDGKITDIFESSGHGVDNIGTFAITNVYGNDELMKLGVWTNPNPRRGFGHAGMTILAKMPIFVYRQWVRHRYGSWSALPTSFDNVVLNRDFYIPEVFRKQVGKPMQYTYEPASAEDNEKLKSKMRDLIDYACVRYGALRSYGVSSENAALILPYTFRVRRMWTANVESLMNYFSLRVDGHAQEETRRFAEAVYPIFKDHFPWANKMFLRHLNFGKSDLLVEDDAVDVMA